MTQCLHAQRTASGGNGTINRSWIRRRRPWGTPSRAAPPQPLATSARPAREPRPHARIHPADRPRAGSSLPTMLCASGALHTTAEASTPAIKSCHAAASTTGAGRLHASAASDEPGTEAAKEQDHVGTREARRSRAFDQGWGGHRGEEASTDLVTGVRHLDGRSMRRTESRPARWVTGWSVGLAVQPRARGGQGLRWTVPPGPAWPRGRH